MRKVTNLNIFVKNIKRKDYRLRLAEAQSNMEKVQHNLDEEENKLHTASEKLDAVRRRIALAQDAAVKKAKEVTRKCSEAVAEARNELQLAQDQAMANYDLKTQQPTLPGIKPEDLFVVFKGIAVLRKSGWLFGQKPTNHVFGVDKPVDVKGLVSSAPRIPDRQEKLQM